MKNPTASIERPPDTKDAGIYALQLYESALKTIKKHPLQFSSTTPCAVCGKPGHPFKDCQILQNVEYLRTHHIQYCLQARRMRRLLDTQVDNVPLHLVETVSDDGDDSSVQE